MPFNPIKANTPKAKAATANSVHMAPFLFIEQNEHSLNIKVGYVLYDFVMKSCGGTKPLNESCCSPAL